MPIYWRTLCYQRSRESHLSQSFRLATTSSSSRITSPKHISKLAMRWFHDAGIKVLKWAAQSPDLNPIEHLWVHLKNLLRSQSEAPRGVLELWERVREAWKAITAETCQTLIESMPWRVEAVIKSRDGQTK